MTKLDMAEVNQRLASLQEWALSGDTIQRTFTFASFPDAVSFIVRLGFDAEAADHHPDLLVNYKRVRVTYSTHSEHGLTEKDFAGAVVANRLAVAMGAK